MLQADEIHIEGLGYPVWEVTPRFLLNSYYSGNPYDVFGVVYLLYFEGVMQYIGKSKNLVARIVSHNSKKEIRFDNIFFTKLATDAKRSICEDELIKHFLPPCNKVVCTEKALKKWVTIAKKEQEEKDATASKFNTLFSEMLGEIFCRDEIQFDTFMGLVKEFQNNIKIYNTDFFSAGKEQISQSDIKAKIPSYV